MILLEGTSYIFYKYIENEIRKGGGIVVKSVSTTPLPLLIVIKKIVPGN